MPPKLIVDFCVLGGPNWEFISEYNHLLFYATLDKIQLLLNTMGENECLLYGMPIEVLFCEPSDRVDEPQIAELYTESIDLFRVHGNEVWNQLDDLFRRSDTQRFLGWVPFFLFPGSLPIVEGSALYEKLREVTARGGWDCQSRNYKDLMKVLCDEVASMAWFICVLRADPATAVIITHQPQDIVRAEEALLRDDWWCAKLKRNMGKA